MLTEQGTHNYIVQEDHPLNVRIPELRDPLPIEGFYLASPIRFLSLDEAQRPKLITLERDMLRRYCRGRENMILNEKDLGEIEDRIKANLLPSAIFNTHAGTANPDNPITPDITIEVSFPEAMEKIEQLNLVAEYYVYHKPKGEGFIVSKIRRSPDFNIGVFESSVGKEQFDLLNNYDLVLRRNTGIGLLETILILSNPESSNSMGVTTQPKLQIIGDILGFPQEEQDLLSTIVARVHRENALQAGAVEAVLSTDLFSKQEVFVSPLERPWEIEPIPQNGKYDEKYMGSFIRRNLELCITLNQRPYTLDELSKMFHVGSRRISAILDLEPELIQQRENLFDSLKHSASKTVQVETYLRAHPELQELSFQDQQIKLKEAGIEAYHTLISRIVAQIPELDELRKASRNVNLSDAGKKVVNRVHTRDQVIQVEDLLRANPSLLEGSDQDILVRVNRELQTTVPYWRIKRVINSAPDLSDLRRVYLKQDQRRRGVENVNSQRENLINFAGLNFGSAAEAIFGLMVLNYTRNDFMTEGREFQVDGQLDFVVETKEGKTIVVEYHSPWWEKIKGSNMDEYVKKRKELMIELGKGDLELRVFEGFKTFGKTKEIMDFFQENLKDSKDVYLNDEAHIKRVHDLVHKGVGSFVPKTKDEEGNFLYLNKPKEAIKFVLNHPTALKQLFPDIRVEDMIYYFRSKISTSEDSNEIRMELLIAYPELKKSRLDELILEDQAISGWFVDPLPKAL